MELHDLQEMTVANLREEGLKHSELDGVNGMSKSELITALAPIFGINLAAASPAARKKSAANKATMRQEIRTLKTQRDAAASEHNVEEMAKARRAIKKRKRSLRHMAPAAKAAAV